MQKKAHTQKIQFSGTTGLIVLIGVVIFAVVRFMGMSNVKDAKLEQAVTQQIQLDLGSKWEKPLADAQQGNFKAALDLSKAYTSGGIKIHSLNTSSSLLSWSTNQDVVVKAEFSLPGELIRQVKYYRFQHSPIGGWRNGVSTTPASFYMNLL